ncbi:MAG: hypothetical protein CSA66_01430 [Proteobacteria bacterium]|nr:MAG: hypothetical protein CSA66_01430 [Pseudomonadota bacterium]
MALTVVLSVTAGFEAAFQERILGLYPHLLVTSESSRFSDYEPVLAQIRDTEGVVGATPLTADAMMAAHEMYRAGANIQGVDLATIGDVIDIERLMKTGGLEGLAEDPTLTRRGGGELVIDAAVEGTWLTVVLRGGDAAPVALFDHRVVPDAGHARVKLLDLRTSAGRSLPTLLPRGGDAADVFQIIDEVALPGAAGGAVGYGRERELPAGQWELSTTGERLELDEGTLVTLVLLDGEAGGRPDSLMLVEPSQPVRLERTAHVRVVDARRGGDSLRLVVAGATEPVAVTEPGSFTGFAAVPARRPGILLGTALAKRLRAKTGDPLTLVTPLRGIDNKMMGPFGMLPSSSHFTVAGTFEAGFHDHDSKLAIINIEVAQRFLNRGQLIHSIAVRTRSLMDIDHTKGAVGRRIDPFDFETLVDNTESLRDKVAALVQPGFGVRRLDTSRSFIGGLRNLAEAVNLLKFQRADYARRARFRIHDWKEKNINLFRALELQKVVLTMFFLIIILVGSFVVVGSQIMVVHEKTSDIAILKAMGATSGLVRLIFTLQGAFVALAGAFLGLVAGLVIITLIELVDHRLDASIYLIDRLPVEIDSLELVLVAAGAVVITLLTTQVSAGRAAAKTPVDGLRAVD